MSNTSTTTSGGAKTSGEYENNPFFVATNGLDLLFKRAQSIGILTAVIAGLSALSSLPSAFVPAETNEPTQSTVSSNAGEIPTIPAEIWLTIILIVLVLLVVFSFIGIVVRGVLDYTAAKLARGEGATISEAFRAVFSNFWSYTWVLVIVSVKTFLWSLLFVVPGIIMSVRYSLAGVAYFDKQLKGDASVQHSSALVKNAWLTTFASQNLLNLITLGIIQPLLTPGTNGILYRQLGAASEVKPKAHFLSWLTLILPIILFGLIILGVVLLGFALANYSQTV